MVTELPLVRTSERTTFTDCRLRWWWAYVEHLVSKETGARVRPALVFGDLIHQSLAAFYIPGLKRGPHPKRTFRKLYAEFVAERGEFSLRGDDERFNAGELGEDILTRYVEEYGTDDNLEIIAPEYPFAVKMKDVGGKEFWYVSRLDALALWRPTGEYCILEHKTGSENKKNALQMDEQAGSYWATLPEYLQWLQRERLLKRGVGVVDLEFILYNFLRKSRGDARPKNELGQSLNKDGSVSKKQPVPAFERIPVYRDEYDRRRVIRRIREQQFEMRLARDGKLPIYKRPTEDCSWKCVFFDMCELHEIGSDWEGYRDQMFVQADPYEEYRRDTKEVRSGNNSKTTRPRTKVRQR